MLYFNNESNVLNFSNHILYSNQEFMPTCNVCMYIDEDKINFTNIVAHSNAIEIVEVYDSENIPYRLFDLTLDKEIDKYDLMSKYCVDHTFIFIVSDKYNVNAS